MADLGRPSEFTNEIADKLCGLIASSSMSLKTICEQEGMPPVMTVYGWLRNNEDFQKQYARAKEDQADYLAEEMMDIADDGRNDFMKMKIGKDVVEVENKEFVNRSRLRVDTRKWIASKLKPKKYADRIDNRLVDENGNDRSFEITLNLK